MNNVFSFNGTKIDINKFIQEIQIKLTGLTTKTNSDLAEMNKKINMSLTELYNIQLEIENIKGYDELYAQLKAQIEQMYQDFEDIKKKIAVITYCEVED